MMIDLHTHIISGVDDGADSVETSVRMLKMAEEDGITDIVLTPHFIPGSINNVREIVLKRYSELYELSRAKGIKINLYPGSEVFIDPSLPDLVENGSVCTLNNSSYVLVELPMMSIPEYTREVIYELRLRGYVPIIAHPERNRALVAKPNTLKELVEAGALAQVNSSSLRGLFGRKIRETALIFIRHDMVHFIASDAHTCRGRSPRLASVFEMITREFGRSEARRLIVDNGRAVLDNREIDTGTPVEVKKKARYS